MNTFISRRSLSFLLSLLVCLFVQLGAEAVAADVNNYRLGPGDVIRVSVFQNPDMQIDTRVSEDGTINYPLLGTIQIGESAIGDAERKIADLLRLRGFLKNPQVNIQILDVQGNKVSVLGQVNKPGSFALPTTNTRLSVALADAGGVTPIGADRVVIVGTRAGSPFRAEVDIEALYRQQQPADDLILVGGDTVYVPRAPMFYIYGEVLKPGNYRLDRGMTMRQAIATGGGLTPRGTENRLKVVRGESEGKAQRISTELDARVQPDDVIYVSESLF